MVNPCRLVTATVQEAVADDVDSGPTTGSRVRPGTLTENPVRSGDMN